MSSITTTQAQFRGDSTILPILSSDLATDIGFIQIADWQYLSYLNTPLTIIPLNRTQKVVPIILKNCFFPTNVYDSGISDGSGASIQRTSGSGYQGGYGDTPLNLANCSVQAKATSTTLSCGISLQNNTDTIAHNYDTATVRHSITLGQNGQGSIRENGALVSNKAFFQYKIDDTVMIEVKAGIVRYYLIDPNGLMKLLRQTRSKLTVNPTPEFLLYFTGSYLTNVAVFSNDFVTTSYESVGVAFFRNDLGELYWQNFQNQRAVSSLGETLEMADKRTQVTYPNQKRRQIGLSLTPKAFSRSDFWKFQDFVNWHDINREFIFIDYGRKDLDNKPTEFWAKFTGALVDATRNTCQFDLSQGILEDFRNDFIPRIEDLTPPVITFTSLTVGSAILVGTASDNVMLRSLQVYKNGFAYGAKFLPDSSGDWAFTVPSIDLAFGMNSFYVVATDYGGNTAQSITRSFSFDSTPPTTPTGLNGHNVGGYRIDLAWNAATDNVAVTGYRLKVNGGAFSNTVIDVGNFLSYKHLSSIEPITTYTYQVAAYDANNNLSAYSATVTVTTGDADTFPPSIPIIWSVSGTLTSQALIQWYPSDDVEEYGASSDDDYLLG